MRGAELPNLMALERAAGKRRFINHEAPRFPRGRSAPGR